jgi:hypothetical protein
MDPVLRRWTFAWHCIINQKDKGTWDGRGRDGRTNFTLRIKEQATRLTLHVNDDDDDDDKKFRFLACST